MDRPGRPPAKEPARRAVRYWKGIQSMQSMTEAAGLYTATAPAPPDSGTSESGEAVGQWLTAVGSWLWERRPTTQQGWYALLIVAAIGAAWLHHVGEERIKEKGKTPRKGGNGVADAIGEGLAAAIGGVFRLLGRFVGGRPLWGEPKSDASFWKSGTRTPVSETAVPLAQLGSVAAAPAGYGFAKDAGPSPLSLWFGKRAVQLFGWIDRWEDRGWRGVRGLEVAGTAVVTAATYLGKLWRLACSIGRGAVLAVESVVPVVKGVSRFVRSYPRWAFAGVAAARLAVVAVVAGWTLQPTARGWILLAVIASPLLVVAAAITGPNGLKWWRGYEADFADLYAPHLWAALVPALKLGEDEVRQAWIELPHDPEVEGAGITVRLPSQMLGTDHDRQALHQILHAVVPGQWVAHWQTRGRQRFVRFFQDPSGPGADAEYGAVLWQAVRPQLGVPAWEVRRDWLTLAADLSETAAIRLRLPSQMLGTERERQVLHELVDAVVPGTWVSRAEMHGGERHLTWTREEQPPAPDWWATEDPATAQPHGGFPPPAYAPTIPAQPVPAAPAPVRVQTGVQQLLARLEAQKPAPGTAPAAQWHGATPRTPAPAQHTPDRPADLRHTPAPVRHTPAAPPAAPRDDDLLHGPGLWAALRTLLHVPDYQPRRDWLRLDFDLSKPDAAIMVRLPAGWLGEPGQVAYVVDQRVPGEWVMETALTGGSNFIKFTRKPAPKARPELPEKVSWKSKNDPRVLYFGETHDGEALVLTGTATPHIGVSGETGSGKSTLLYIAVVVARQAGELVTLIDPKQNSMPLADGKSGIRIHTETYDCVWAIAEFFTSMMATETRKRKGWKPSSGDAGVAPVGRLLVIDELPSFREFVAAWWKYIIKERGFPPVLVWFQMILMQGRSSDHRVAVGTHQFSLDVFGSTMARDQVGTKMVVGETSDPSWAVAYGATTPRFHYDETIPGRGVISTKGRKKKKIGADGRPERVEEIQFAYISPDVERLLDECPPAPAWFDAGEMAPWITPADVARADSAAAVGAFLNGGYSPALDDLTQDTDTDDETTGVPRPRSEHVSDMSAAELASAGASSMEELVERLAEDDEPIEDRWTLAQACQIGIVGKTYGAAREQKSQMAKRGESFPEGEKRGRTTWYTREELESVFGSTSDTDEEAQEDA